MDQPFHSPTPTMSQTYNNRDNTTRGDGRDDPVTVLDGMIDPSLEYIFRGPPFAGESSENQAPVQQPTDNLRLTAKNAPCSMPPLPPVQGRNTRVAQSNVAQPGTSRGNFLMGMPLHDYMLPQGGLINATVVDIIAILPQWFRNPHVLRRFLNNGIAANVQFSILEDHRHLGLTTGEQLERARDHLSDTYRKQMRKYWDPKWTKQTHRAPVGWNLEAMSIHDFTPECLESGGPYVAPPSIPFKDLAIGLKKLPKGKDAGDLTRALDYAMRNQKLDSNGHPVEFVFPDDIQLILNAIGRTPVTAGNTDVAIITRHHHTLREVEAVRRKKLSEERKQMADARRQQELAVQAANQSMNFHTHQMPTRQPSQFENGPTNWQVPQPAPIQQSEGSYGGMPLAGMGILMPAHMQQVQVSRHEPLNRNIGHDSTPTTNQTVPELSSHLPRTSSQEAVAEVAAKLASSGVPQTTDLPPIPSVCALSPSQPPPQQAWQSQDPIAGQQQIETWIAANQTFDLNGLYRLPMHPAMLLRDCADWFTADDMSEIARATRWVAAFGDVDGLEWTVGDAGMIVGLLDAQANGFEGI